MFGEYFTNIFFETQIQISDKKPQLGVGSNCTDLKRAGSTEHHAGIQNFDLIDGAKKAHRKNTGHLLANAEEERRAFFKALKQALHVATFQSEVHPGTWPCGRRKPWNLISGGSDQTFIIPDPILRDVGLTLSM